MNNISIPKKLLNNNAIVTIVTPNYLHKGLSAIHSAKKYNKNCDCYILYLDNTCPYNFKNIKIYTIDDIKEYYTTLNSKYPHQSNELRWSLKPIILLYLLNFYHKVIYIDPDIFFVNDWNFLYDNIDGLLLSPHFYENEEGCSVSDLCRKLSEYGYFNAGFVGASRKGTEALRFWANMCYSDCKKNIQMGLFDDQKYLEIIMYLKYIFKNSIQSINHFGCNIAPWNLCEYLYSYKNIFFHFSDMTDESKIHSRINIFKYYKFIYYYKHYINLSNKIKQCILKK
jgi:hypothetical protein